jgi:hypothetical protein
MTIASKEARELDIRDKNLLVEKTFTFISQNEKARLFGAVFGSPGLFSFFRRCG